MSMNATKRHVDGWSWIVMSITCVLFVAALFLKGLTHDLLLEAGVFLVSVKLIRMAYKNSVASADLKARLDDVQDALGRLERLLTPRSTPPKRTGTAGESQKSHSSTQ
jgi:hypothetical protein